MAGGRLFAACEKAGLEVVQTHPPEWSVEFRRRWRAAFALPEADWRRAHDEWDLLGTELAPALERRAAIRAFDARRAEAPRVYGTISLNYREVLEIKGVLPDHAWWRSAVPNEDLYIVHSDWDWSFVLTHEEAAMGIGPFFVENVARLKVDE